MSKNIVIQEGGVGKTLTVDKLKTSTVGGGSCQWVPEDETQLGTKYISENGTYRASDDGYYGYSEVTVSGVGTATGKDPDGSGDDAQATVDPDTGEIVITKFPESIKITTAPQKSQYVDGETIDLTGIVVVPYIKDGSVWRDPSNPVYSDGTVPVSELSPNPNKADISQTSGERSSECSDFGQGPWPQPINSTYGRTMAYEGWEDQGHQVYSTIECDGYIALLLNSSGDRVTSVACAAHPGSGRSGRQIDSRWPIWETFDMDETYTHNGMTVYYKSVGGGLNWTGASGANLKIDGQGLTNLGEVAWAIVYGSVIEQGNEQEITVEWPRQRDGKVLTDTFIINVFERVTP